MASQDTRIDLMIVAGAYVLAHGLMLLNNGVFWDDWLIVQGTLESITEEYREYGLPFFGHYHHALNHFGVSAYRALVFLSYLAAALAFHAIVRRIEGVDRKTALILTLIFALFPSNAARISIMASRITLCYALFFIGLWLLALYLERRNPALRIASLACLFASFLTHSFLVFHGVVLLYLAYHERSSLKSLPALARALLRYLDFLLLPVVFWGIKLVFYQPHGRYRGYNQVTPETAAAALQFIDNAFVGGFVEPLVDSFRALLSLPLWLLLPAALIAILGAQALRRLDATDTAGGRRPAWLILAGLVFFVAGVFPYLAVGKVPAAENWDSRHQLLTPLGASFMLVGLAWLAPARRARNLVGALLVGVFAAAAIRTWIDFQKDWYKEVALMENFRTAPEIERGTHFLFEDRTTGLDAMQRVYRPYEYAGLLREAFGDDRRQGRAAHGDRAVPPWTAITIEHGPLELTLPQLCELRVLESRDERAFRDRVRQVVRVSAR